MAKAIPYLIIIRSLNTLYLLFCPAKPEINTDREFWEKVV